MHFNRRTTDVVQLRRVVYQLMQLIEPHPAGIEPEDEQHAFNEIGLA